MMGQRDEGRKLLYIVVRDNESEKAGSRTRPFCYTRPVLQSTLQLIGCKARHAFKMSKRVFAALADDAGNECCIDAHDFTIPDNKGCRSQCVIESVEEPEGREKERKQLTVTIEREKFLDVVCNALCEYRYFGPNQRADVHLACRIRERRTSMTILLCGTSGCGKSTLSNLLASRLGITSVVSTDSVRHMMRSFVEEKDNPLLWASTYHAGEYLDPLAVADAISKKKVRKSTLDLSNNGIPHNEEVQALAFSDNGITKPAKGAEETCNGPYGERLGERIPLFSAEVKSNGGNCEGFDVVVSQKTLAVRGYKAQSEMVIDSLDRLITSWEQKKESAIVEGVHLSLNFVMGLMKKHPSIIPFLIFIANEEKHLERFAVRAKYMTLDPTKNRYVKYIRNIRAIQEYLCKRADKHLVPKVNNTSIDRSIAMIHATIFSCLRRREGGESLYDQSVNTVKVINEEFKDHYTTNSMGSKGMLKLIRRKGSSRELMALMNNDGSVARAWRFRVGDTKQSSSDYEDLHEVGSQLYESLRVEEAKSVNLQFGNFGLSAWSAGLEGTSHVSDLDGLIPWGDDVESSSSRMDSSCFSFDGPDKEIIEDNPVSASDEEVEEEVDADSDEEIATDKQDEMEGSVDEESIKSDEEEADETHWDGIEDRVNEGALHDLLNAREMKTSKGECISLHNECEKISEKNISSLSEAQNPILSSRFNCCQFSETFNPSVVADKGDKQV